MRIFYGSSHPKTLGILFETVLRYSRSCDTAEHVKVQRAYRNSKAGEGAGEWRGLEVAIKKIVFEGHGDGDELRAVASEAAISTNLSHRNVIATYSHDIVNISPATKHEPGIYKFYLVRSFPPLCFTHFGRQSASKRHGAAASFALIARAPDPFV
jgi:hypothetical protein